jgi:hypothetical protein
MKSWLIAGAMMLPVATISDAAERFWVVGNHATNKCEIVTSNPLIYGNIWFGDGPFGSLSDAKLARSTIGVCPKEEDPPADCKDGCEKRS